MLQFVQSLVFYLAAYHLTLVFLELSPRLAQQRFGGQTRPELLLLLWSQLIQSRQKYVVAIRRHATSFRSTKIYCQTSDFITASVLLHYVYFLSLLALEIVLIRTLQKSIRSSLAQNLMIIGHYLLVSGERIDQIFSVV